MFPIKNNGSLNPLDLYAERAIKIYSLTTLWLRKIASKEFRMSNFGFDRPNNGGGSAGSGGHKGNGAGTTKGKGSPPPRPR